jgi:hypothetical protein
MSLLASKLIGEIQPPVKDIVAGCSAEQAIGVHSFDISDGLPSGLTAKVFTKVKNLYVINFRGSMDTS